MNSQIFDVIVKYKCRMGDSDALKVLANEILDQGQWVDGLDIAVSGDRLNSHQNDELCSALLTYCEVDNEHFSVVINRLVEMGTFCSHPQILHLDGFTDILTDNQRLYKIVGIETVWVSRQVSFDGIANLELRNLAIIGKGFSPFVGEDEGDMWYDFAVDAVTGELLAGSAEIDKIPFHLG